MDVNSYKTHYSNCGNKLSDFKILKELGKGSYGTVYTVRSYIDDNIYVMKKMELNNLKEKQQKECYREVSILKKVSHQNIIKYYSSFLDSGNLYIIMEYAEGGDLYSLIKHYKRHNKHFDEFDIWRIAYEVLNGLDYLHKSNIIHRDIKCLNLFITKDQHIKIGDLGVSTIVSNINALHCTRVGTPLYLSPELVKQVPYDFKVDIWSCGCSVYHLACLDPPFMGDNLIVLGNNIVKGKPKALPQQYSEELNGFIDKMLSKRPEKRPSAKEGLEMIPKDVMEKIKVAKEKNLDIKVRPFSAVGNRIITYNKEEIMKDDKGVNANNKDEAMPKIEELKEKSNEECNNNVNRKDKPLVELVKQNENKKQKEHVNNAHNVNNNILIDNNNFINHGNGISSNKKELIALLHNNNNTNNTPKPQTKNTYNNYLINTPTSSSNINSNKNFQSLNAFRSKNPTPPQNSNLIAINQSHQHSKNQPSKLIDNSIKDKTKSRIIGGFGGLVLPQPLINIEKVENFMINEDQKPKSSHTITNNPSTNLKQPLTSSSITTKPTHNTLHKNLIPHQRNSSLSPKENITEGFKFPDLTTSKQPLDSIPDIKSTFSRRLLSSKFPRHNTPSLKTRPLTASSTKILSSKWKSTSSSRPVTAFIPRHFRSNHNNNNETPTTSENEGGVINININLYNIDMNRRFLDPNLNPLKQGNDLSMLMNSNKHNNEDVYNNKCFGNITHNLYKQTVNLQDIAQRNNNNEFIFAKIIKTIEHARKGNKPLTIRDFEESSSK